MLFPRLLFRFVSDLFSAIGTALGLTARDHGAARREVMIPTALPTGLGRSETHLFVEPQIRRLVADHLGMGAEVLGSTVSMRDDLAADSLDLVELALLLERSFDVTVSDRILADVRTYGDLVKTTVRLILARTEDQKRDAPQPLHVWASLLLPQGVSGGTLERVGRLTAYTAETIAEDAHLAGPGARLEIVVAPEASDAELAGVYGPFAHLAGQGVQVNVRRYVEASA
jgi:acyl carrier protein